MKHPITAVLLSLLLVTGAQAASPVVDSSYVRPDGERVLELSIVLPVPLEQAWDAFTSEAGFRAWGAPAAWIDLRVGGEYEASYDAKAGRGAPGNIRNRIVALVPPKLVVVQNVQAPPNPPFDAAAYQQTQTAFHFSALGPSETRLTLQNAGYRSGPAFDGVYKHFQMGNTWTLEQLLKVVSKPRP